MRNSPLSSRIALILVLSLALPLYTLWREADCGRLAFAQAPANASQSGQTRDATPLDREIHRILTQQQAAWNRGDTEAFMQPYLQSDNLTFSSGGKVTRGWRQTLENYRQRYPTREAMGRLTFSELEVSPLGEQVALVLGNWHLTRDKQPDVGGNFTLVFQQIDQRWQIVHDHTSRREPQTSTGDAKKPPREAKPSR